MTDQVESLEVGFEDDVSAGANAAADALKRVGDEAVVTEERVTRASKSGKVLGNQYGEAERLAAKLSAVTAKYGADLAALEKSELSLADKERLRSNILAQQEIALQKAALQHERWVAGMKAAEASAGGASSAMGGMALATAGISRGQAQLETATAKTTGALKLQSYQIINLGQQLQDIVVSLAGGQNPFLVMVQQVPQATSAVGGMGNAMKLLMTPTAGVVAGMAALAAGMAMVVTRAVTLNSQMKALQSTAAAYGNGTMSGAQAQAFSNSMADASPWFSRSDATAATKNLIQIRSLAVDTLTGIKEVASDFSHVTGQELSAGTKSIADAFAKGYQGVKALDEQYGFLTADQLKVIRGLYQTGQGADAAKIAMASFAKQMKDAADLSKGAATDGFAEMAAGWNKAMDNMASSPAMKAINDFLGRLGKGVATIGSETPVTLAQNEVDAARQNLANVQNKPIYQRDLSELVNPSGAVASAQQRVTDAEGALAAAQAAEQQAKADKDRTGALESLISAATSYKQITTDDLKKAGELSEAYGKQAAAIGAATQADRDRIEVQNQADKMFAGEGMDRQKAAYIAGELANRAAARAANVREMQRETDATGAVTQAYRQSEAAGLRMAAVLDAQKQARAGTISSTDINTVSLGNLTKATNESIAAISKGAPARALDLEQATDLAAAAKDGALAEGKVSDAYAARKENATALATAMAALTQAQMHGTNADVQGAAASVAAINLETAARERQLGIQRQQNLAAEAAREMRVGNDNIRMSERELELMAGGIPADERTRILEFERTRLENLEKYGDTAEAADLNAQARRKAELAAQKDMYAKVERWAESTADSAGEFMVDALDNAGEVSAKSIAKSIGDTLKHTVFTMAVNAAVTPYVQQGLTIAGSAVMSAFNPAVGVSGAAASAGGAAAGGGGGASNLMGAASVGYQAGSIGSGGSMFSGISNSVNAWGAETLGTAQVSADFVGPLQPGVTQGTTFTEGLGSVAGGLTAGYNNYLAITSGTAAQKTLTPVFTAMGAAIGSVIPGIGTWIGAGIGSTIGTLVGGLFGRKKAPDPVGVTGYVASAESAIGAGNSVAPGTVLGQTWYGFQNLPSGPQNGWGWATSGAPKGLTDYVGAQDAKALELVANLGYRYGANLAGQNIGVRTNAGTLSLFTRRTDNVADAYTNGSSIAGAAEFKYDPAKDGSIDDAVARLSVVMLARASSVANDNLAKAAKKIDTTLDAKSIDDLLSFAENFDDAIQTMMGGVTDVTKAVGVQTRNEVMQTIAAITDFREKTSQLGLDTTKAAEATKSAVQVMLGLKDAAAPLSDVDKALQALDAKFANIGPLLDFVGITDTPASLKAQALANMTSGFNASLADTIAGITDPTSLLRKAENDRYAAQLADAKKLNADLQKVEQLHQLKMLEIDKQANQAAEQAREAATSSVMGTVTDLGKLVQQWQYGDASALSPESQLGMSERSYNAVSGAALAGDYRSFTQYGAAADQYLTEARSIYGSGAGYADAFARVMQDAAKLMERDPQDLVVRAVEYGAQSQVTAITNMQAELVRELKALREEMRQSSNTPARAA